MTDISILSASRIARVAQSENLEKATQMGFLDRIIDYFKGGVKREAIQTLFERIAVLKSSGTFDANRYEFEIDDDEPGAVGGFGLNESDRLETFLQLRDLALPEHKNQFKYDIHENKNSTFGCSIKIGSLEIYKTNDIHDFNDQKNIPKFFMEKFRLNIEDSAKNEDPVVLLKTLNEIHTFVNKLWADELSVRPKSESPASANDRQEFSYKKMGEIFSVLPDDTKSMLFSKATSDFGNRIRDILHFSDKILDHANQPAPVQIPGVLDQNSGVPSMLMVNDSTHIAFRSMPSDLYARLTEVITICADQPDSEARHTPISGTENNYSAISNENPAETVPLVPVTSVTSHRDLTDAETRALNTIGISSSLLSLL